MIIKNDTENMKVEEEIQHIVKSLNLIIKKIGCRTLVLNNRHTIEDIAFIEIFLNNLQIKAGLMYFNIEEAYKDDRLMYLKTKKDFYNLLYDLFENHDIAIINTDTLFLENAQKTKANYNIEIFKDYSPEFIKKIVDFYKPDEKNFKNLSTPLSEKSKEILTSYINNEDLPSQYTRQELLNYQNELPKEFTKKAMIYNSITANYIKGINTDLEKFLN